MRDRLQAIWESMATSSFPPLGGEQKKLLLHGVGVAVRDALRSDAEPTAGAVLDDFEQILQRMGGMLGVDGKFTVTQAKNELRERGGKGTSLASRLSKRSKVRNGVSPPGPTLEEEILCFLVTTACGGAEKSSGAACWPTGGDEDKNQNMMGDDEINHDTGMDYDPLLDDRSYVAPQDLQFDEGANYDPAIDDKLNFGHVVPPSLPAQGTVRITDGPFLQDVHYRVSAFYSSARVRRVEISATPKRMEIIIFCHDREMILGPRNSRIKELRAKLVQCYNLLDGSLEAFVCAQ